MTATADDTHFFQYIDSDVPDGATLVEWRREQDSRRRAGSPHRTRPSLRIPSVRMPRMRVRFA